jgi:hypothetical protein
MGGGLLVIKLVKPTKTLGSWTPHDSGVNQFLLSKAEPYIRAAAGGILGKADSTVRRKVRGLDSPDRIFYKVAKLLTLFVAHGRA